MGVSRNRMRHGDRKTQSISRQLKKKKSRIQSAREKTAAFLRILAILVILAIFALLAYGAVEIMESEQCRYPKNVRTEEFRYKIDNMLAHPRVEQINGKNSYATGAKLETIVLAQGFGTYTVLANKNPLVTDVVVIVENRAAEHLELSSMTQMFVNATVGTNPITGLTEPRVRLEVRSSTSNTNAGAVKCRRADVTLIVPTACLLEETKLEVGVEIGEITVRDLTYAGDAGAMERVRFDTIALRAEKGSIVAQSVEAHRLTLNTSSGTIEAADLSAHHMFMLQRGDGGKISGSNINLFSGDVIPTCAYRNFTRPGYPRDPERRLVCEQELGKLTIDSEGADRGADASIIMNRVTGGSISSKIRVGHARFRLKGCVDFAGTFALKGRSGTKKVKQTFNVRPRPARARARRARAGAAAPGADGAPWGPPGLTARVALARTHAAAREAARGAAAVVPGHLRGPGGGQRAQQHARAVPRQAEGPGVRRHLRGLLLQRHLRARGHHHGQHRRRGARELRLGGGRERARPLAAAGAPPGRRLERPGGRVPLPARAAPSG